MKKIVLFTILGLFIISGIAGIIIAENEGTINTPTMQNNSIVIVNATSITNQDNDNETEIESEAENYADVNLSCCQITISGKEGLSRNRYRFMREENCISQNRYPRLSLEVVDKEYCKQEIEDRFEHIKEVKQERNRLKANVAAYLDSSECPEECTCAGSTIKCELNGARQMTIVAGNSGNVIIQIKGINASTNVTLYKADGKLYGVFKGNQTRVILGPDQVRERIKHRLKVRLEQENITLNDEGFYEVQAKKKVRLFLIIPIREHIMSHVDAETGEIIKVRTSWWGFLAKDIKEESEQVNCGDATNSDIANSCCQDKGYDSWDLNSEECVFSE